MIPWSKSSLPSIPPCPLSGTSPFCTNQSTSSQPVKQFLYTKSWHGRDLIRWQSSFFALHNFKRLQLTPNKIDIKASFKGLINDNCQNGFPSVMSSYIMGALLWDDSKKDQWSEITWIKASTHWFLWCTLIWVISGSLILFRIISKECTLHFTMVLMEP